MLTRATPRAMIVQHFWRTQMAVSKNKKRRMTTIPKSLDQLIVRDAKTKNISVSKQIAAVLEIHYQAADGYGRSSQKNKK